MSTYKIKINYKKCTVFYIKIMFKILMEISDLITVSNF